MTPIAKVLGSALIAMIIGVAFGVFSCTRSEPAKTGPGTASCKGRVADVLTYMKRFKDANVLTTDVAVPPDETKAPKALAFDPKRRILECDVQGCRFGSTVPLAYGASLTKALRTRLAPKGTCEPVYLALSDTLPPAQFAPILAAVKGCSTFALTRSNLKKLPAVEPSGPTIDKLKTLGSAKTDKQRKGATQSLVDTVLKPHAKTCGKTQDFLTSVGNAKGYEKFTKVLTGLESQGRDFEPCLCTLDGQDDKVLFQVAGFNRLGGTLFVYSAKKVPAAAAAKPAKSAKTWYDFVRTL